METDVSQDVSVGDSNLPVPAIDTWGVWVLKGKNNHLNMGRDTWFPTMWHFDKYRLRPACVASF